MPSVEGELCHVPATSPKPTEAHGCQGGCGGRLHGTCGSIADDNEMHRICSQCLAKREKRKAVAPPKRKATAPPKGAGAGKSKARKTKKFLIFEQKVEVLDMLQRKVSHESIADGFGCSELTVRQIKADRVMIKEQATKAGTGGKKISRQGDFPEVRERHTPLETLRIFVFFFTHAIRAPPAFFFFSDFFFTFFFLSCLVRFFEWFYFVHCSFYAREGNCCDVRAVQCVLLRFTL